jgi:hypothetical protein
VIVSCLRSFLQGDWVCLAGTVRPEDPFRRGTVRIAVELTTPLTNFNLLSTSPQALGPIGAARGTIVSIFVYPLSSWIIEDWNGDQRKLPVFIITWPLCLTLYNWQPKGIYEAAATIDRQCTDMLGAHQIPIVEGGSVAVQVKDSRQFLQPFLEFCCLTTYQQPYTAINFIHGHMASCMKTGKRQAPASLQHVGKIYTRFGPSFITLPCLTSWPSAAAFEFRSSGCWTGHLE